MPEVPGPELYEIKSVLRCFMLRPGKDGRFWSKPKLSANAIAIGIA